MCTAKFMISSSWFSFILHLRLGDGFDLEASGISFTFSFKSLLNMFTQGISNRPIHSEIISPQCMACPWHGANFKKRFNYVKVVMFSDMIFCYGEELTVHVIYMPDYVVINTSYIIKR